MSSLIRFHYRPSARLYGLFDDVFHARLQLVNSSADGLQRAQLQRPDSFRPRLDLRESNDLNTVTASLELPGLTSDDITIDLHHNRLTVSGESVNSNAQEGAGYAVRERHYGKFSRTVQLPFGTKPEDVNAKMENGILTVTFPKATSAQAQRIEIQ